MEPSIRTPTASQYGHPESRTRNALAACAALLAVLLSGCATQRIAPLPGAASGVIPAPPSTPAGAATPAGGTAIFLERAQAMLGQPYRFGGAQPGGFDCSGLVVFAARDAGARLPRTTQELLSVGDPVPREQLRAGDLVFLHLAAKELHVGIALDERRFIHAPSSGGFVRIDTLEREPYARGFLVARRIRFPPAAPTQTAPTLTAPPQTAPP